MRCVSQGLGHQGIKFVVALLYTSNARKMTVLPCQLMSHGWVEFEAGKDAGFKARREALTSPRLQSPSCERSLCSPQKQFAQLAQSCDGL